MATQTLANFGGALKRFYLGPIRNQLNNTSVLWTLIRKNEEDVAGEDLTARIPLFRERNQGIGARAELGTLPVAGRRAHTQTTIAMTFQYGQIQVSGQAIKASRDTAYAFAKVIDNEIRGMVEGVRIDLNRQMWGDGSGFIMRLNNVSGSISAGSNIAVNRGNIRQLEEGMRIDSHTAKTGGTQGLDGVTIDTIDTANSRITLEESVTIPAANANDFLFREDSRGNEMMGLLGIVDSSTAGTTFVTTLQGISRSTNTFWNANVLDNPVGTGGTNRPLTLDLIQQACEQGEIRGGARTDCIISNYELRRRYLDLLVADRRYSPKELTLDGGWTALEYSAGGDPIYWVVDRHCPRNEAYFLDKRTLAIYRAGDFDWMDLDGAVLRKVNQVDAYEATLYAYINLGVSKANANTVLRDVSES